MINGSRVTDKTRTICKHCMRIMPYTAANTSTMQRHIQHHHSSVLKSTTAPVKNKPDNADTRIRTSTSTVKRQSHNNNKRHRCFHRSSYEAIFCGRKSRISATPPHTGTEVHHPITSAFYPHSDPETLWRVQEQGCTDTERRRKHRHNNRRLDIEKYAKLHHNYSSHNQQ